MGVAKFWRDFSHRYNLEGTRCLNCHSFFFPPRVVCPKCRRKGEIEPYKFSGRGEVVTYSVVHDAPNLKRRTPYVLAIIKLEEGPRLLSEVVCDPEEIDAGMQVSAVFRKIGEEGEKGIIYYGTKFVPLL